MILKMSKKLNSTLSKFKKYILNTKLTKRVIESNDIMKLRCKSNSLQYFRDFSLYFIIKGRAILVVQISVGFKMLEL